LLFLRFRLLTCCHPSTIYIEAEQIFGAVCQGRFKPARHPLAKESGNEDECSR
jgi:hypothetical protein